MKIIADSGSTKTAWRLVSSNGNTIVVETPGINPYYQEKNAISALLKDNILPYCTEEINEVYFYGAGCTGGREGVVGEAIAEVMQVSSIEVNSDLLGAARALCGSKSGIVCILGTGSNSCYYNGKSIVNNIPPLGFILGDEGSGGVLGKRVVADYLKNMIPSSLRVQFEKDYSLVTSEALEKVYRSEFPNRYLAGFTPFLSKYIGHVYCEELVISEFQSFITRNVMSYKESREVPVSFTGSVSYYFENQLKTVLQSNGLTLGKIIQHPIGLLVEFHCPEIKLHKA